MIKKTKEVEMVKLVIDIPKEMYERIKDGYVPLGISKYLKNGTPLTERPKEAKVKDFIKHKIDYLEDLASIETNEGRWREEEKYLYGISVLEEVVEYMNTSGGGKECNSTVEKSED